MTNKPFTITNIGTCSTNVIIIQNKNANTYGEYLGNYIMVSFDNVHFTSLSDVLDKIEFNFVKNTTPEQPISRIYVDTCVCKVEPKQSLYIKIAQSHIQYEDKIIDNILIRGSSVVLSGNINSLLAPKYLDPTVKLPYAVFKDLFHRPILFSKDSDESIVSAEDLEMPSIKLPNYAYHGMFLNCKNLIHPPKVLPAKNIKSFTYADMFRGCINLQEIPDIKAEILISRSCSDMFASCISLKDISNFPRKIKKVYSNACDRMFFACNILKVLPSEINITNIAEGYIGIKMFDQIDDNYNYPLLSIHTKHILNGAYFRMFPREESGKNNRNYPMSVFSRGRLIW